MDDAPTATANKRKIGSDLRRRDLLDSGQRLFVEKGFANTAVDDITRAAGVAKGTFYLYFKSKDDLVAALRERFTEDCRQRIETLAAPLPQADWVGRLDAWVEGGIRHYLDHVELHDVIFVAGEHAQGSMADSPLVMELAALIRAGAAAGAWSVKSPELVALFLFYALHGIVDHTIFTHRSDPNTVIRQTQRLVRNAVGVLPRTGRRFKRP